MGTEAEKPRYCHVATRDRETEGGVRAPGRGSNHMCVRARIGLLPTCAQCHARLGRATTYMCAVPHVHAPG